jgi:hypothetical protein
VFGSTSMSCSACRIVIRVRRDSNSFMKLLKSGDRCCSTTNAMPLSAGRCVKKRSSDSRPPADAPIPTMCNPGASAEAGASLPSPSSSTASRAICLLRRAERSSQRSSNVDLSTNRASRAENRQTNPKLQAPNPNHSQHPNPKTNSQLPMGFGVGDLGLGTALGFGRWEWLGFGAWDLGFDAPPLRHLSTDELEGLGAAIGMEGGRCKKRRRNRPSIRQNPSTSTLGTDIAIEQ